MAPLPIYEVDDAGRVAEAFVLEAIAPDGFVVDGPAVDPSVFDDLPWFLQELRPAGFLGRMVARSLPRGLFPADIRWWGAEHALEYAFRFGWSLPGSWLVGEEAVQRRGDLLAEPPDLVSADQRDTVYPERIHEVLAGGDAGSSAAGEQPKFLATRRDVHGDVPVIVKFSPRRDHRAAERIADLLVAEHIALRTLHGLGHAASRSEVLELDDRVLLEVERFDRTPSGGRRSVVSLQFVDAQFVGSDLSSWADSVSRLVGLGLVDEVTAREVRFREQFGAWIANSDQHFGNLAFHLRGLGLDGLTPAYDVNPAAYAPIRGDVPEIDPPVRIPRPSLADVAPDALVAASAFWEAVRADVRISDGFRGVAEQRLVRLGRIEPEVRGPDAFGR